MPTSHPSTAAVSDANGTIVGGSGATCTEILNGTCARSHSRRTGTGSRDVMTVFTALRWVGTAGKWSVAG